MELLAGVAATALAEGVKFLYQQAGELLRSWRERRRDAAPPPPRVLSAPAALTIGDAQPIEAAPDQKTEDALLDLQDLVEPIKNGDVEPDSEAAREAIASLRDLVQAALRTSITFVGEVSPPVEIEDVRVVAQRVSGRVTGVRARLSTGMQVRHVDVATGDVESGGEVTGVDAT